LPKVRANLTATFAAAPLSASAKIRYIGKSKVDVTYDPLFTNDNNVASRTYLDLFASFTLGSKVKLSVGMNNVFDTAPPQTATTYTGVSTLYDLVGRYFFVQASAKL
jgi:iron complex outermembrane receptor protein